MSACAYCAAEVHDTVICGRCIGILKQDLRMMPDHAAEIHVAMQRMVNMVERNDGGKSADTALVFNEKAAEVLHDMRGTLVGWCRLLWEERHIGLPHKNTIRALSDHLLGNVNILVSHSAAGELADEVATLVRDAVKVIDSPELRSRVELGPCIETVANDPCPGPVVAYIYADGDMMGNWRCVHCKREWQPREWRDVGPLIMAREEAA